MFAAGASHTQRAEQNDPFLFPQRGFSRYSRNQQRSTTRSDDWINPAAGSDIDLFVWGLTEEQANQKILDIYNRIADNCPFEVLCFRCDDGFLQPHAFNVLTMYLQCACRSAYAISIVSQYPFRHVQIVLRLYSSPFEILAGFDVDSCAVGN